MPPQAACLRRSYGLFTNTKEINKHVYSPAQLACLHCSSDFSTIPYGLETNLLTYVACRSAIGHAAVSSTPALPSSTAPRQSHTALVHDACSLPQQHTPGVF
eukprot:733839-Pelagomonas_calceolata.AAC.2